MKIYINILFLFFLTSCITEQRCFEKFGHVDRSGVQVLQRDTILKIEGAAADTFWIPELKNQTYRLIDGDRVKWPMIVRDTFTVFKDNVQIQLRRVNDTIRVKVKCADVQAQVPQTIIKREFLEKNKNQFWLIWVMPTACFLLVFFISKVLNKFFK